MMFKEIGQLAGLMRNIGKLKEETDRFQAKLGDLQAEGAAGGDMVVVTANGRMELLKVVISDAAMGMQDREMLEDLVCAAANQALAKVRALVNQEAQNMAQSLGLPAGANLPGMS
jgi:DNA-binding YbaB/EbfC family protein